MPESIGVEASARQSKQRSYTNTDTDVRELSERVYTIDGRVMVLEKCVALLEKSVGLLEKIPETIASLKTQMYITWVILMMILTAIIGMAVEMFKRLPAP